MAHGQQGMKMRLRILRGSLAADDEAGGLGQCPMDPEVWGKLPEDIIWRVLLFVPVGKQFQLQSVSPEWRQKLTSNHFRLAAAAARASRDSESEEQQQQRVVACVSRQAPGGGASSSGSSKLWKVVEIDLSFVPRELWSPTYEPYSVEAAANGLVIISVVKKQGWVQSGKPLTCRYCVLNPLTRTCIELPAPRFDPPLHWMPPTPAAVSVYGYIDAERPRHPHDKSLVRAMYKLAGSGAGDWVVVSTFSDSEASRLRLGVPVGPAAMAGETAWSDILRRWTPVLAERSGSATPIGKLWCPPCVWTRQLQPPGEAAVPAGRSSQVDRTQAFVVVAADKGAVVLVAGLALKLGRITRFNEPGTAFGLWQMPRDRADWVPEAVTELNMPVVMRLVPGLTYRQVDHDLLDVVGVYAVKGLVCCRVEIFRFEDARRWQGKWVPFTLGFNLDTGEWQLVQGDEPRLCRKRGRGCSSYSAACAMTVRDACMPFELRPDLFLDLAEVSEH